jgi:phage terminase large subunit-like protein
MARMLKSPLSITDFVDELKLLKAGGLSVPQRAVLKATYGDPLNEAEMEIYCRATGRDTYATSEHNELTVIAGRQSGKTSRIGALIALYEACRNHGLPRGQRAYVLVIAPVVQQAAIAFDFMRRYILGSPILERLVFKIRNDEIELRNGVVIACRPCSYRTVRGVPIICVICDEMAFWQHEQTAANPEQEVIDAIRPGMAALSNTKIVKISTTR